MPHRPVPNFCRIAEIDVLYVRPKGEGHGCPESLPQGGLDALSLILERGIKPIPTLSLPLKGRELRCQWYPVSLLECGRPQFHNEFAAEAAPTEAWWVTLKLHPSYGLDRAFSQIHTAKCTPCPVLRRTLESIATPCCVNVYGRQRRPPLFEITNCDLKFSNSLL